MAERTAIVRGARDQQHVEAYLPSNYRVVGSLPSEKPCRLDFWIRGEDVAGWTLDDYVIPRLASGLVWAEEQTA